MAALFLAAFALPVLAAACGDDDDSTTTPTKAATTSAATSATGSATSGGTSSATATTDAKAQIDSIKGDTTGVTDKEVKIGSYVAKTGPAAVYDDIEKGWNVYFDEVNKKGGIAGRQIKFIVDDDGYNPTNTVNVVKKLVEQDQVFSLFNGLGTPGGNAVLPYLKDAKVPSLFIASGDAKWADQGSTIIGLQPDYVTEGTTLGKYVAQNYKGKKFGILFQNDDFGKEGRDGLKKGVGDALTVVGEETYEANAPDINAQATKLINAGAEVLGVFATPTQFAGALKYVKAQGKSVVWVSSAVTASSSTAKLAEGAMDGVFSAGYLPDPSDPDPAVQKVVQFFKDHGIATPNSFHLYSYMAAEHLERLLTVIGKNLNRESLTYALDNVAFQGDWKSTLLRQPSIVTKSDHKVIEYEWIQKWDEKGGKFQYPIGDIINSETTKR